VFTLPGPIGYAIDNLVLYVKGGAAVTSDKYNTYFTNTGVGAWINAARSIGAPWSAPVWNWLRAELVGRIRVRPPVHGQCDVSSYPSPPRPVGDRSISQDVISPRPPNYRRRPGRRQVLIGSFSQTNARAPPVRGSSIGASRKRLRNLPSIERTCSTHVEPDELPRDAPQPGVMG
jgi:hypothetical protein